MTPRDRYVAILQFEPFDQPFVRAIGGWPETGERWRAEGWDGGALETIFGTDTVLGTGVYYGPVPGFAYEVLHEDEQTRTYVNHEGIIMREFKAHYGHSSMPKFIRFPVESADEFGRFAADRLQPRFEERVPGNWADLVAHLPARTDPLVNFADRWGGFFGPLRNLMGLEGLCLAFYDDPQLIGRMMDQRVEAIVAITERVLAEVEIDMFAFWEDMAFNHGPLLSPRHFDEFMVPRYAEVCAWLRSKGVELIGLDSDGDITELIPLWLKAGINVLWPFERAAGMDVLEVRRQYGRDLALIGGIDKRVVARGGEVMRQEVDRVLPLVEEGGYIPELDHSAPPDISWPNMCEYMEYLLGRLGRG